MLSERCNPSLRIFGKRTLSRLAAIAVAASESDFKATPWFCRDVWARSLLSGCPHLNILCPRCFRDLRRMREDSPGLIRTL